MSQFYSNPKASSVIVARTPCAFAKRDKGGMGTHPVTMVMDAQSNLLFLGCECEHVHGDTIAGMHELGTQTCYAVVAALREDLDGLTNGGSNYSQDPPKFNILMRHTKLPNTLRTAVREVWTRAQTRHNGRLADAVVQVSPGDLTLTALANRVYAHAVHLPQQVYRGNPRCAPSADSPLQQVVYPTMFKVFTQQVTSAFTYSKSLRAGVVPIFTLAMYHTKNKEWVLDEDNVKQWAKHVLNAKEEDERDKRHCEICDRNLVRPSKHLTGAAHIDRVHSVVKLVSKAISPMGVRMVNHPRHRSVFFR